MNILSNLITLSFVLYIFFTICGFIWLYYDREEYESEYGATLFHKTATLLPLWPIIFLLAALGIKKKRKK